MSVSQNFRFLIAPLENRYTLAMSWLIGFCKLRNGILSMKILNIQHQNMDRKQRRTPYPKVENLKIWIIPDGWKLVLFGIFRLYYASFNMLCMLTSAKNTKITRNFWKKWIFEIFQLSKILKLCNIAYVHLSNKWSTHVSKKIFS